MTRYKGKNYDPNYHGRRNQASQQHPQGNDPNHVNYPPTSHHHPYHGNPFQQQGPHPRHNPAHQQRQHHPHHPHPLQYHYPHPAVHQYHQQQTYQQHHRSQQQKQKQHYAMTGSSAAAMQVIEKFRSEVHTALVQDFEGDIRMCSCQNPGGTMCFHGIAKLYQNQLTRSAALQHDIVELLNFLMERDPYQGIVSTQLTEYINSNPATPLRLIVETMGIDGLVTRGIGSTVNPAGVELLIDITAPSDIG
ncbi:hypothetical protein F4680DRAFT_399474 [Xylaria scruposa]|nr:hypothetical protein F4680DRAFT_399474 [Xylaria scruposa]